jgi:murein DD-endopeptidase MepM/ murein hydrolase activator NlpD
MNAQCSMLNAQWNCRFALCIAHCALVIVASACATPVVSSAAPGLGPTQFVQTRVVEILTQTAPTAAIATPLPTALPTAEESAAPSDTPRPLPTAGATITPPPTPPATNTPATPCADAACAHTAEHFWLERPIPTGFTITIERTYPYGSTQNGAREPHHGVEFENHSGTPVLAAGAGTVVVAGDDSVTAYGPSLDFYGNVVVIQLDQAYNGQPVFNLYGHLSQITATMGQHVNAGDPVGAVGLTGVAVGPHLHFEVRVGQNDYFHSRNPELWLKPLLYNDQPWGVIAGRVVDTDGHLLAQQSVVIRPLEIDYPSKYSRFIATYAAESLNGDDLLQENFATGDLPLGTYSVSVNTTKLYQETVRVEAGQIAWVTFVVKTPTP